MISRLVSFRGAAVSAIVRYRPIEIMLPPQKTSIERSRVVKPSIMLHLIWINLTAAITAFLHSSVIRFSPVPGCIENHLIVIPELFEEIAKALVLPSHGDIVQNFGNGPLPIDGFK